MTVNKEMEQNMNGEYPAKMVEALMNVVRNGTIGCHLVRNFEILKQYDNGSVVVAYESHPEGAKRVAFIEATEDGFRRDGMRWSMMAQ